MRRLIVIVSTTLALTAGMTGGAVAADFEQNPLPRDSVVGLSVSGTSINYSARGFAKKNFYGHIDVLGPGWRVVGGTSWKPTVSTSKRYGAGTVCAHAFEKRGDGTHRLIGKECTQVK